MQIYERYIQIRELLDNLEIERREVEGKMLDELKASTDQNYVTPAGTISYVKRESKSYKYSEDFIKLESEAKKVIEEYTTTILTPVNKLKDKEEKEGIAEVIIKESESIRFTPTKKA